MRRMVWLGCCVWMTGASAQTTGEDFTVTTYNLGLAYGFVEHAEPRRDALIEQLAQEEADVMCFQEVWTPEDRDALQEALGQGSVSTYAEPVAQRHAESRPACGLSQLFGDGRFVSCMQGSCSGLEGKVFTDCIVDQCGPALDALKEESPSCAQSLMAQVGKSAMAGLWTVIQPFSRAGVYAYGGSDGLVLASRLPMRNSGMLDFTEQATLNRRRAYYADVDVAGTDVRVYCTHLTADLSKTAPYPGPFASWEEENETQMELLLEHAANFDGPVVLAGDFNCSLPNADGTVKGEHEASCRSVLNAGYQDLAAESPGACTYCADNGLLADDVEDVLLDHVFVRGWTATAGERIYDDPRSVEGVEQPIPLSDHYGYRARVSPPPAEPTTEDAPAPE